MLTTPICLALIALPPPSAFVELFIAAPIIDGLPFHPFWRWKTQSDRSDSARSRSTAADSMHMPCAAGSRPDPRRGDLRSRSARQEQPSSTAQAKPALTGEQTGDVGGPNLIEARPAGASLDYVGNGVCIPSVPHHHRRWTWLRRMTQQRRRRPTSRGVERAIHLQGQMRPNWHIDVQQRVEPGEWSPCAPSLHGSMAGGSSTAGSKNEPQICPQQRLRREVLAVAVVFVRATRSITSISGSLGFPKGSFCSLVGLGGLEPEVFGEPDTPGARQPRHRRSRLTVTQAGRVGGSKVTYAT